MTYIPTAVSYSMHPQNYQKCEYSKSLWHKADREADHLVLSLSAFLVDSDLFLTAGRTRGSALTGLNPVIIHILWEDTAETPISDCADIHLWEKIKLVCILKRRVLTVKDDSLRGSYVRPEYCWNYLTLLLHVLRLVIVCLAPMIFQQESTSVLR